MKKIKIIPILTISLMTVAHPAIAAKSQDTNQQMLALMQQMNERMAGMQQKINSLQSEVNHLKGQDNQATAKRNSPGATRSSAASTRNTTTQNVTLAAAEVSSQPTVTDTPPAIFRRPPAYPRKVYLSQAAFKREKSVKPMATIAPPPNAQDFQPRLVNQNYRPNIPNIFGKELDSSLIALYLGGTPVFSSPYIGINSAYDGSNLITNASTVNLDVRLMEQQEAMQKQFIKDGIKLPSHPIVNLSGRIIGQASSQMNSPGNTNGDVTLASAELETFVAVNPFVSGFMTFTYDDSATSPIRVTNSRIFMRQGFVTVGNLLTSPWYSTIGQFFPAFGHYSTFMLSADTPQILGRVHTRAFNVGYQQEEGLFGAAYLYEGNTKANGRAEGGVNVGVGSHFYGITDKLAIGFISNLADSEGMQSTGAPGSIPFKGFGENSQTEDLRHAVPATNINLNLNVGPYTIIGEYVRALRAFSPSDLTFNGVGAEPQAFHIEGDYNFMWHGHPGSYGLGIDYTKQALALLLPQDRILAVFNIALWRDTLLSFEYRHDVNYKQSNTASGAGSPEFGPLNKRSDMITGQFGIFF